MNVGDPAPDFTLTAHDGKPYSLKACAGKPVVLVFYCVNDTPG